MQNIFTFYSNGPILLFLIIVPKIAKLYSVVCNSEGIQTRAVSTIGEISS